VGLFPDVVRRTCKFLGATYRNQEHFEESKMNVKNACSVVKTQEQVNQGCLYNSVHYGAERLTMGHAQILFAFLRNSIKIGWESLVAVSKPVLFV